MRESPLKSLMLVMLWAGLLGAGLSLIVQPIWGDPVPNCINCNCKEVQNWKTPLGGFTYGCKITGTNHSIAQAIPLLAPGGCQSGSPDLQDNEVDLWTFQIPAYVCVGDGQSVEEVNVVDAGSGLEPGEGWAKCYVTRGS